MDAFWAVCLEVVNRARALGDTTLLARAVLKYMTQDLAAPERAPLLEEALAGLAAGDSALRALLLAKLGRCRHRLIRLVPTNHAPRHPRTPAPACRRPLHSTKSPASRQTDS